MSATKQTGESLKPFVKIGRARDCTGIGEHWSREEVSPTVNLFDLGDTRAVVAIVIARI